MADHQVRLKGVGVVVVLTAADLEGHPRLIPVVVVVVDDPHRVAEPLFDVLGQGGFAAAGAAGDADKNGVRHGRLLLSAAPYSAKFPSMKMSASRSSLVRPVMRRSAVPTIKSTWVMESLSPRRASSSLLMCSPPLTHSG